MRTVEVLGPVRVDGQTVTSRTQVTLLAALAAASPDAVPFHRLVDAVWDDPPPSAENSLHSHLTRLRRTLGPGSIVREGDAYRLASPTDAAAFLAVVDGTTTSSDPAARRRGLAGALALWRGPPFGSLAGHRFVHGTAEALTTVHSRAVRRLAECDLIEGDPLAAVSVLQGLVATQPLDEESWACLVEALQAAGRRAEALRAVQDALGALADVGLDPSARLGDAEAAVLRSGGELREGADLPRTTGSLVGRTGDVEAVAAAVESPGWTTLVGPGGVGKTRLAIESVGRARGPVVFCDLTDVEAVDIDVTIARAAGAPLRPPYLDRIATRLDFPATVLLLDCCEAAIMAIGDVGARLMDRCRDLRVIATSRRPLGIAGERLIEIEPLAVQDAVELLRHRIGDAGLSPPDRDTVEALCAAVDCLPLTIEMIAGSLRSLSAQELLDASDDPLAVLGGPDGDLTSSVARSIDLLDDDERTAFERLSMFRGPFVLETAIGTLGGEAARATAVNHLRSLRDRSLLSSVDTGAGRRLRMLDTIRAVGRNHLEQRGGAHSVEEHFVDTFRRRSAQIDAGLRTTREVQWLAIAEAETVDLRAAHRAAIAHHDATAATTIAASMFHLVYDRLRPDIAHWADETIDAFGDSHPLDPTVRAVAALGAMHTDDHARARAHADRACSGDGSLPRHAGLVIANLALRNGDLRATAEAAVNVVSAAERADDDYSAAIGHLLHALAIGYGGDLDAALEVAGRQRAICRRVGAPTLLAYADYLEGELLSESDPQVALELLRRAHDRAVASRSPLAEGVSLVTITSIRARSVEPSGAEEDFGAAIRHWLDRGDWNRQWATLRNLAEYLARTEREEAAALIIGAVDAHGAPAYGAEAPRLDRARRTIEQRLGPDEYPRLRAAGRSLTAEELLEEALAVCGP